MLISLKHHFIYVANRHTDEFETAAALAPYAEISRVGSALRRCQAWPDIKSEYQFVFSQPAHRHGAFFKFGVVREPVDWVRAFYRQRWQLGEPGSDAESQQLDFARWWALNAQQLVAWNQAARLADWGGHCAMDLVIPYEHRRPILDAVRARLSLPPLSWPPARGLADAEHHAAVPESVCREIREYFPESTALHAAALQDWDAQPSVGRRLQTQVRELPVVRHATLLDLPIVSAPEEPIRLVGVLLLDPAAASGFHMAVQGARAVASVRTNLPSPACAKLYPDLAQAAHAKFVIDGLCMHADAKVVVRLGVGDQEWDWLTLTQQAAVGQADAQAQA